VRDAGTSALAGLLHGVSGDDFAARPADALRADLAALAASSGGAIAVADLPAPASAVAAAPAAAGSGALAARAFTGAIPAAWRVSSFSGLVARRALETPDHDAVPTDALPEPARVPEPSAARTAFDFPGGVRMGTLVHALFERVDFADPGGAAARELVDATLADYDVDASWAPVMRRMLRDVLTTPLDGAGLTLQSVAPDARIAELEFVFPVDAGAPQLVPGAAPPRGFMRGYIDLVFVAGGRWYVLDWKSNRLGARAEDYAAPRLAEAMRASLYDLQYRLYTVALHRHLQARLPGYDYDAHFGGVFYLFVRGMRPENGASTGVFFARPARAETELLSRQLSARGAA
jgi:exodeoxyribonuclease V beta subunit